MFACWFGDKVVRCFCVFVWQGSLGVAAINEVTCVIDELTVMPVHYAISTQSAAAAAAASNAIVCCRWLRHLEGHSEGHAPAC
jgi:hypothetical protein